MQKPLIVCRRVGRSIHSASQPNIVRNVAARCRQLIQEARRDGMEVIHVFGNWPPGEVLLHGCEARANELVIALRCQTPFAPTDLVEHIRGIGANFCTLSGLFYSSDISKVVAAGDAENIKIDICPDAIGLVERIWTKSLGGAAA